MTDFLALWHSPTTLVFLVGSAGLLVWWRATNMRVSFTWEAKTQEPEPSKHAIAVLKGERDEAREQAQLLRDEIGRKA